MEKNTFDPDIKKVISDFAISLVNNEFNIDITYDSKVIAEMSKPSSLVWYMLET